MHLIHFVLWAAVMRHQHASDRHIAPPPCVGQYSAFHVCDRPQSYTFASRPGPRAY